MFVTKSLKANSLQPKPLRPFLHHFFPFVNINIKYVRRFSYFRSVIKRGMTNREIILEYTGHLTFSTIGRLLTLLKHKMVEKGIKIGVYKRILSVMIESLENIYKYSDQYHENQMIDKNYLPTFKLERVHQIYIIKTTSPIKNSDVIRLKDKIDLVNSKTEDELKALYRQTITNGQFTAKGGAGLGLIEMAKITNNSLGYRFEPVNDYFSIYHLTLTFQ
jgi:hypothetical protein